MNYENIKLEIGTNIRVKRQQFGLSLNALADELGVSYQQIQKYEKGQNAPPCDKLILLARIFHCAVDDLIVSARIPSAAEIDTPNPWQVQGVSALVAHFSRIPQRRIRESICRLVKLIADGEGLKNSSDSSQYANET